MTRIAIVGGGTMGSIYTSLLTQSTHQVWLVDIWAEHIQAIRQRGLRIDGPGDQSRVIRTNATTSVADVGPVDVALLAVKAFETEAAALPRARVAIGVSGHGGTLLGPGHVAHRVAAVTHVGWLSDGAADDLASLATLL